MRISFVSSAFVWFHLPISSLPLALVRPPEPHARALKRLGCILIINHKERISVACTFVAHTLPVGPVSPVQKIAVVEHFIVQIVPPVEWRCTQLHQVVGV
jgi:hypothetical protein